MAMPPRKRTRLDIERMIMSFEMNPTGVDSGVVGQDVRAGALNTLQGPEEWDEGVDTLWDEFDDDDANDPEEGDGNTLIGNDANEVVSNDTVDRFANDKGEVSTDGGTAVQANDCVCKESVGKSNEEHWQEEETNDWDEGDDEFDENDDAEDSSGNHSDEENGDKVSSAADTRDLNGVDAIVECLKMLEKEKTPEESPGSHPKQPNPERSAEDRLIATAGLESNLVSQYREVRRTFSRFGMLDEFCTELLHFLHDRKLCHGDESLRVKQVRQIVLNHFMEHRAVGQGKVQNIVEDRERVRCVDELRRGVVKRKKAKKRDDEEKKEDDPQTKFYKFIAFMFDMDTSSEHVCVMGSMGILSRDVKFFKKVPLKNVRDRWDNMRWVKSSLVHLFGVV